VVLCLLLVLAAAADARPWSWLGVRIRDLSEQEMEGLAARHGIREGFGVVIVEVMADTPAARGGLKNGDIIVAFGERPVVETRMLQRLIASAPIDREVRLTVLREDGRRTVPVRLTSMPRPIAGERVAAEFGFVLREVEPSGESGGGRLQPPAPAVAVVIRGSPAERAGLEVGDGILQINDRSVLTPEAAREALADVSPGLPLHLTVRRGQTRLSLTLSSS
jgi:S1-C subfamily serine protease